MNKLLSNLILILSSILFLYPETIKCNADEVVNHKEIVETINHPMQFQQAIQEITKHSGIEIKETDIIDGINALKSAYPKVGYFTQYFALRLDNTNSLSITNQFFDLLKEFRQKTEAEINESLHLFGRVHPEDIIAGGVLRGDVFLLSQDEDGLALLVTFSKEEPKIIFTLVRAEWDWGSSWWGEFNGFSYFSYSYNTQTKALSKRYSRNYYHKMYNEKEVRY